jgi:hypothetical protein
MYSFARLQRLYQVRSFRTLDIAKKRGVTLLYWILSGGHRFARKAASASCSVQRAFFAPLGLRR